MNSGHAKRLSKAKSQEILDLDYERPVSPPNTTGIMSKVKKVLGSYAASPLEKRRTHSLSTLGAQPIFGVAIENLLQKSAPPKSRKISLEQPHGIPPQQEDVPYIVVKIINHIEQNGLKQEGIYRVNGNARIMDNLKVNFDRFGDADFKNKDIFSVGGLLKLFLRELPVSLIPENQIDEIAELQEAKRDSNGLSELRTIVKKLPKPHYDLLKALCRHLMNVSLLSEENKMTHVSLSIVFGPSVLKCGGGLEGLKKQGNANAGFAKMIQHYSIIFEDSESLLIGQLPEGPRIKKVRKKPRKPEPFHKHMEQKQKETSKTETILDSQSPYASNQQESEVSMDDAIDEAFEAVIREDIEANAKKQRKSEGWLATPLTFVKPRNLFQSIGDDVSARVSSPYSWKSSNSPGTSPTTSPVVSPRTSQVFTTLIGDSVQDNLFETQTLITSMSNNSKQDTISTYTSNSSVVHAPYLKLISSQESSYENLSSTNNKQDNTNQMVVRQKSSRSSLNRRSAIYGAQESHSNKKFTSVDDLNVQLLTVDDSDDQKSSNNKNSGVITRTGTVSAIAKQFNEKESDKNSNEPDRKHQVTMEVGNTMKQEHSEATDVLSSDTKHETIQPSRLSPPMFVKIKKDKPTLSSKVNSEPELHVHVTKPNEVTIAASRGEINEQQNRMVVHSKGIDEFDYVSRTTGVLFHPTLQRVRVPFKRAKPSRRSMILKNALESKKDKLDNATQQQRKESVSESDDTLGIKSEQKKSQDRNISVSSIASVSAVSKLSPLSSPIEVSPDQSPTHVKLPPKQNVHASSMDTIVDGNKKEKGENTICIVDDKQIGLHIAPEDRPVISSKAWSKDTVLQSNDLNTMSFEELLKLALKLRTTVKEFESNFARKHGRKPSTGEKSSVSKQIHLLNTVKKKLKEIKANEKLLNSSAPASTLSQQRSDNQLLASSVTKLDQQSPSKQSKLTRHQSLVVSPVKTVQSDDSYTHLIEARENIISLLSDRRKKADRPEDIRIMTYDQLLEEKQTLQKLLLNFEKKYSRPQTREEKDVMRPIYDRYREIKKQITHYGSKSKLINQTGEGVIDANESTLATVTILQSSLTIPSESGASIPSGFSQGPSSFVLPLSPKKHSKTSQKHNAFKEKISSPVHNTVLHVPSLSSEASKEKSASSPLKLHVGSSHKVKKTEDDEGYQNIMSTQELEMASISELNYQLVMAAAKRKELRKELREFEQQFEDKYKRKPLTKEDKKLKLQQYIDYREVKLRISNIKDSLDKRTKKKVERTDA